MSNFGNNPEFPDEEPQRITPGNSTDSDTIFYILDTLGKDVLLADVRKEDNTVSVWASQTFNGRLYGRFRKIVVDGASAEPLACYRKKPTTVWV